VWHSLPQVFVGMPCQLQPVVQLLCEEMELSFLEAGRPCPPWREWAATINRWMSDQYVDIIVPEPTATDEEVVEYIKRCCQFSGPAAGPGSAAGNSGASASTTSTCSPVDLNQQRLQDKMHVSSVLSSASTSSRRCVPEPLHKQLGFSAVAEDEAAAQLLPSALRDASFTSVTSEASAESVQMLCEAQAAAKAAEASGRSLGIAARSLSVPSAELLSSSADSGSALDAECFEVPAASPPAHHYHQQPLACAAGDLDAADDGSFSSRPSSSAAAEGKAAVAQQQPAGRSKSLLTVHMQLKAQLQQQQHGMLFPAGGAACTGQQHVQGAPHLQQRLTAATLLQQAQQQAAPQQQMLLQQLQLQHQQMLAQHMAMQQLQQQGVQQQQLAVLQQRCSQSSQPQMQGMQPLQQQQQCVAPLLPVVHTVRPCGVPVAVAQPVLHQQLQQQQPEQQQQPRQPPVQMQQLLQAMQAVAPAQQEQPRLLRLIQRK
jgi:hypothetical protein